MHASMRLAACCGVLAVLTGCGGGGSANADPEASALVAKNAPHGLPALQDLGTTTYAAPTLATGASVAVGALQNGGFALAWLVTGAPGSNSTVQVQTFNPRGKAVGGLLPVALDRHVTSAGLTVLPDGTLVVAFVETRDDIPAFVEWRTLLLERFDRQGRALGAAQAVVARRSSLMAPDGPSGEVNAIPTRDGGFALAWQDSTTQPGYPAHLWGEVQRFDANGVPLAPPTVVDAHLMPSPTPVLRIEPLPDGGILVPQPFFSLGLQTVWQPEGNPARVAMVPADAFTTGHALPYGGQFVPLEGGGYVALLTAGLQFYGNDGVALGAPVPVAQGGRLVALAGGGFAIFASDGTVQAYDASGQPVGPRLPAGLPQVGQPIVLQPLAGGAVVAVQPGAGSFAIDLLVPAR
jgi:hypothetical protein